MVQKEVDCSVLPCMLCSYFRNGAERSGLFCVSLYVVFLFQEWCRKKWTVLCHPLCCVLISGMVQKEVDCSVLPSMLCSYFRNGAERSRLFYVALYVVFLFQEWCILCRPLCCVLISGMVQKEVDCSVLPCMLCSYFRNGAERSGLFCVALYVVFLFQEWCREKWTVLCLPSMLCSYFRNGAERSGLFCVALYVVFLFQEWSRKKWTVLCCPLCCVLISGMEQKEVDCSVWPSMLCSYFRNGAERSGLFYVALYVVFLFQEWSRKKWTVLCGPLCCVLISGMVQKEVDCSVSPSMLCSYSRNGAERSGLFCVALYVVFLLQEWCREKWTVLCGHVCCPTN